MDQLLSLKNRLLSITTRRWDTQDLLNIQHGWIFDSTPINFYLSKILSIIMIIMDIRNIKVLFRRHQLIFCSFFWTNAKFHI